MALFRASQTVFASAVEQIADAAGASGDTEMRGRAFISLNAAIKHFNTRHKWNWLWTEAAPINVLAPFSVSVSASAGQGSGAVAAGHGFLVDDMILASGLMSGTRITATAAGGIGFSTTITGFGAGVEVISATAIRDFYDAPSDLKDVFSVRLLGTQQVLQPIQRRAYDRTNTSESQTSTPEGYDLFQLQAKGKVRLLPPPGAADVLQIRHFRAMATASASGSTDKLDIPADYDPYLIAYAKWHFLTDKGAVQQATVWHALAQEGLTVMLRDQTTVQDENLGFSPGHMTTSPNVNSTRLAWDY